MGYVTESGAAALHAYKYSGVDKSLTYKYVLSPFAQWCVDKFTPMTVAPNSITFGGLLAMVLSYLVMLYYAPTLGEAVDPATGAETGAVPRWVFFLNGFAMIFYQTLDNMDGKQARRTNKSSPLGMLFDHGCDAINSPMGSMNWAVAIGISLTGNFGDRLKIFSPAAALWTTLIASALPFYLATWEEYYTGALVLPIINGPSEGLLLGASVSFASAFLGPAWWHSTTMSAGVCALLQPYLPSVAERLSGALNFEMLLCTALACAAQELILKSVTVIPKYGFDALKNIVPKFVILIAMPLVYNLPIAADLAMHPRTCCILYGVIFVEGVCALMCDHMTHQAFQLRQRRVLFPLVLLLIAGYLGVIPSKEKFVMLVQGYTVVASLYLVAKLTIIINEITAILGIWCFDIVTPRNKPEANKEEAKRGGAKGKKE